MGETNMAQWTRINSQDALEAALSLARGSYQVDVLNGTHNLSGSTLTSKMRKYSGKYAASRSSLLANLRSAGISVSEETGAHGARILVIG